MRTEEENQKIIDVFKILVSEGTLRKNEKRTF